ncbi:hypothetical protein [Marinovum algicola]|uniref:hypothetical protein n=1 Tax=Marinovum algicola TaxID=42444 RepID=UPI0024BBA0D4|nr:hypothetical protein [Marinovum algicola]
MTLFPYVSPAHAESALSFAARLAAIHTGGRLVPFLNDLSINAGCLARGEPGASGTRGPEWLDSQTLEQAVRATELLGALIEFGAAKKVSALTSDQWDRAGRAGFEFTCRGEVGIREALHHIQETFRKTGKRPMHRNVFGRLYEWLASSKTAKEPGDIKRIVREHIFHTVAMAPGEGVLGECLTERRLHSVASLAAETGLHPKTLGYILIAKGLVSAEDPAAVFDAKAGLEVAAAVQRMVNVISVPKVLNCSRPQASCLIDERILLPIATGASGAPGRTQKAVDQRNIDGFLATLKARARAVEEVPKGFVMISKAAEKVKAPCIDIVHLILGGFLSNVVEFNGKAGYAAIHVEPAEVSQVIRESLPGVSPSQAAAKIGVPAQVVWALIDEDERAILPSMPIRGRTGHHVIRRVMLEDLHRFRDGYVKSGDIANHLETDRKTVERILRRYRVQPAYSRSQIGMNLYRLSDLPSILLPEHDEVPV